MNTKNSNKRPLFPQFPNFDFPKEEIHPGKYGCFVTKLKAILYIIISSVCLVITAYAMYNYGPYSSVIKEIENQDIRLPKDLEPILYRIKIDPKINEENNTIEGDVTIRIKCKRNTRNIVLNANNLDIIFVGVSKINLDQSQIKRRDLKEDQNSSSNILFNSPSNEDNILPETTTNELFDNLNPTISLVDEKKSTTNLNVTDHKYKSDSKYLIKLQNNLQQSKEYILHIKFESNASEFFRGFDQSIFEEKTLFLATNFYPIYARKLFPCFDEPTYRSSFQLIIKNNNNQTILSNTNLQQRYNDENGNVWNEFEVTTPIPTYSFGFIIGDLKLEEEEESFKILIRVWSVNNFKGDFKIVIEFTKKILKYLEGYFMVGFPFDKIDLVFVDDLKFTTVSSGLILLKQSLLLQKNSSNNKKLFSELSKSLTKQWIGNLISMNWWDDYWFINAFSGFILEELQSSVNFDFITFDTSDNLKSTKSDDFKSTLNLKKNIEDEEEIFDIINKTKLDKEVCILKMLNSSLAPLTFQKGIQDFIKKWKNNSTNLENLWKSFDLITTQTDKLPENKTVSIIIKNWTEQISFPLITVINNKKNNTLIVTQNIHSLNNSNENTWIIPINYLIGNENIKDKFWLTKNFQTIELKNVNLTKWILFNADYYHVNYDLENWEMLINTLYENHTKIPIKNRAQLINDAFDLAKDGLLNYNIPFNLIKYLINETNYIPWSTALKSLEFIKSIVETTHLNGDYEDYIVNLIGPIYDRISLKNQEIKEGQIIKDEQLKNVIREIACSVNYPNCTKWALENFQNWIEEKNNTLNLSNRKIALCTGIRLSRRREWEIMFLRLKTEEIQIEDLYLSLGCTKQVWLISKYLSATLKGIIPLKYVSNVWNSIKHIPNRTFGFKFLRENWNKIREVYKDNRLIVKTIFQDFLYSLSTKTDKEDLMSFFGKFERDLRRYSYLFKEIVNRIDYNIDWKDKYLETIDKLISLYELY